ncbi:F-box/FBD/LRR-repeat protein [Pyrus ussuriensis x Pyrus communis]|uniref:F-box/FBD/LRR-repeat protein n=1 Tax=Pyrus ussuriensis x Pyrus communis TaxID=2448454 RepID=A0A5N5FQU9_9ROSA|nr:F-box/FBD/LRR-repeat protein [Pyrus ussuriensis x Pyrus communis]
MCFQVQNTGALKVSQIVLPIFLLHQAVSQNSSSLMSKLNVLKATQWKTFIHAALYLKIYL